MKEQGRLFFYACPGRKTIYRTISGHELQTRASGGESGAPRFGKKALWHKRIFPLFTSKKGVFRGKRLLIFVDSEIFFEGIKLNL
jgi:hypothetical protein